MKKENWAKATFLLVILAILLIPTMGFLSNAIEIHKINMNSRRVLCNNYGWEFYGYEGREISCLDNGELKIVISKGFSNVRSFVTLLFVLIEMLLIFYIIKTFYD